MLLSAVEPSFMEVTRARGIPMESIPRRNSHRWLISHSLYATNRLSYITPFSLIVTYIGLMPMQISTVVLAEERLGIQELEVAQEEETVVLREESASIARGMYPGKPQPISQAPSNVYVLTDEDIRQSGAIDLPNSC
jgi:hypothetical protein